MRLCISICVCFHSTLFISLDFRYDQNDTAPRLIKACIIKMHLKSVYITDYIESANKNKAPKQIYCVQNHIV